MARSYKLESWKCVPSVNRRQYLRGLAWCNYLDSRWPTVGLAHTPPTHLRRASRSCWSCPWSVTSNRRRTWCPALWPPSVGYSVACSVPHLWRTHTHTQQLVRISNSNSNSNCFWSLSLSHSLCCPVSLFLASGKLVAGGRKLITRRRRRRQVVSAIEFV